MFVCETESLPRLLKEIMQEAKRLTDAEWCVIIFQLYLAIKRSAFTDYFIGP